MLSEIQDIKSTNQLGDILLQYLYNIDNEGVIVIKNNKISFINNYFLRVTGYVSSDIIDKNISVLVSGYAKPVLSVLLNGSNDDNTVQYIPFVDKAKNEICFDVKVQTFNESNNEIIILSLSKPILDQRLVPEIDYELYHSILNSVSENILVINPQFEIIQIIKAKSDKISSSDRLKDIFSNTAIIQLQKIIDKKIKNTDPKFFEIQNYKRYYEACLVNYKKELLVFSFSEISLRKRIEHQLIDSQIQLGRLNKEKDLLLSIIAHDLKNPFNIIKGFSSVLLGNGDRFDDDKKKEIYEHIYTSSMTGYSLLENLLEWSRSQSNRVHFELQKINLMEIANHIANYYAINVANKNIKVEINILDNIFVKADKNALSTIFRNLFSNAIKFTNEKGKISLSAELGKDSFINIKIKDTGVGMTEDQIKKLFLVSSNNSTQGTQGEKGTGLGLLLCKEFVEKHKGELFVESELNCGTEFVFSLPLHIAE